MAVDIGMLTAMLGLTGSNSPSPQALNALRGSQRASDQSSWNNARTTAYNNRRNDIISQFTALGMPDGAQPYLAALEADYNNLKYTPGQDYSYDPANPGKSNKWDEAGYLAAHPDVAQQIALHSGGKEASDPNYWHSGLDFYNALGKNSPGYQVEGYGQADVAPGLIGGTADYWDDPNILSTKDYGISTGFKDPTTGVETAPGIADIRQGRRDAALNSAKGTFTSRLGSMGLSEADYNQLLGAGNEKFTSLSNAAGLTANDYSGVFDPNAVFDAVTGAERTGRRSTYTTQAKSAFSGLDPNAALADTADDSYISDIVGRSYADASGAVERAYKRGALTDTGYSAGLSELGTQRKEADSTAQTLGGAVLTRQRGALGGFKDAALTDAGGWDFGQQFDPNKYVGQYNEKLGSITSGLGGEIAGALAGQNFFNVGDVLNKAGYAQGAQNTNPLTDGYTTPAGALAAAAKDKNKNESRGVGGVGMF